MRPVPKQLTRIAHHMRATHVVLLLGAWLLAGCSVRAIPTITPRNLGPTALRVSLTPSTILALSPTPFVLPVATASISTPLPSATPTPALISNGGRPLAGRAAMSCDDLAGAVCPYAATSLNEWPIYRTSATPYANQLLNGGCESGDLDPWLVQGSARCIQERAEGCDDLSCTVYQGRFGFELGFGDVTLTQVVAGLRSRQDYQLILWLRGDPDVEFDLQLGSGSVSRGMILTLHRGSNGWGANRQILRSSTSAATEAVVTIRKRGAGRAYLDGITLTLVP